MAQTSVSAPALIVIFGITGDLAQRKLLPALYHLFRDQLLDDKTVILGITRRDISTEEMVKQVQESIETAEDSCDASILSKLQSSLRMHTMSQIDSAEYRELRRLLDDIEEEKGVCMDRLFYLSIPPQMFGPIVRNLGEQGLNHSCRHGNAASRLLIEKPFGYDLTSAEELITDTADWFQENQIFRIDHYVAKDAVQNIVAFRRAYPDFEALWNGRHVAKIDITVFEKLGIEGRATFYEEVGALRDFVQSHLMQIMALVIMDLPQENTSQSAHKCRLAALRAIEPLTADSVQTQAVRGQYNGYRQEAGNPDSNTETYASVTLQPTNERWHGTAVRLQTGKALSEKRAEVTAYFSSAEDSADSAGQTLTFHIEPDTGITVGAGDDALRELADQVTEFNKSHGPSESNRLGYERVFIDAIRGDHTVFTTSEEVLTSWRIVAAIIRVWSENGDGLLTYDKGSSSVT